MPPSDKQASLAVSRQNRTLVRPVSQVLIRLQYLPDRDLFCDTVDQILYWLKNRTGHPLPADAWQRKSFELAAVGAQRTAAVALDSPRFWSARLDDADKNVPARTWITEVGIGVSDNGDVLFGARLTSATRGEDAPYGRTLPGFIKGVLRGAPQAYLDERPIAQHPPVVSTPDDVHDLIDLLEDARRQHPVILVSVQEGSADAKATAANAQRIAGATLGAAHVFTITSDASFMLTDEVGRSMSVYRQGVRLYRPGFKRWLDNPHDHPVTRGEQIVEGNANEPNSFEAWIASQALSVTAHRADREDLLPSFESIRRMAATAQRASAKAAGSNDAELLLLADAEITRLEGDAKAQKETYDGLLLANQQELDGVTSERDASRSMAHALRVRIASLEEQLTAKGVTTPIPDTLDAFDAWVAEHLTGSVTVLNRAHRGVKTSVYEDPTLAYRALLLLRDFYVPMRRQGGDALKTAFEAEAQRLGIENSKVGVATRTHPEQYTVDYSGRRRELDWHLKAGSGRERTHCFRLYYFWDDATQTVVVGWLPAHLDNAMT